MLRVVEFTSLSDKDKKLLKEYEKDLLIQQIPEWCDVVRIGKGKYAVPIDSTGYYGEYSIKDEESKMYVCEKVENDNLDLVQGKFRDGAVHEIEKGCEIISPEYVESIQKSTQSYDNSWFSKEHPELPQYDY